MAIDTGLGAILILVGRLLFDDFLAFQRLNHFMNTDEMAGYPPNIDIQGPRDLYRDPSRWSTIGFTW